MKVKSSFFAKQFLKRCLCVIPLIISSYLTSQTINIVGTSWTVSVPAITEAGTNYTGIYDNPSQLILSGNLPGSFLSLLTSSGANISMHYVPVSWNNALKLYAKRSGGATKINGFCILCTATINNGTTYLEIPPTTDTSFFTISFTGLLGLGNNVTFSAVNTQLEIGGVSVTIPAKGFSAQVVFTIGPD